MRTTYQNISMRFGFFRACAFRAKNPECYMGFSGSVNGTTKNPGFLDFGFCQCKWAYCDELNADYSVVTINLQKDLGQIFTALLLQSA